MRVLVLEWRLTLPRDYRFVILTCYVSLYQSHFLSMFEIVDEQIGVDGVPSEFFVVVGYVFGGRSFRLGGLVNGVDEVLFVWLEAVVDFEVGSLLSVLLDQDDCDGCCEEGG